MGFTIGKVVPANGPVDKSFTKNTLSLKGKDLVVLPTAKAVVETTESRIEYFLKSLEKALPPYKPLLHHLIEFDGKLCVVMRLATSYPRYYFKPGDFDHIEQTVKTIVQSVAKK